MLSRAYYSSSDTNEQLGRLFLQDLFSLQYVFIWSMSQHYSTDSCSISANILSVQQCSSHRTKGQLPFLTKQTMRNLSLETAATTKHQISFLFSRRKHDYNQYPHVTWPSSCLQSVFNHVFAASEKTCWSLLSHIAEMSWWNHEKQQWMLCSDY